VQAVNAAPSREHSNVAVVSVELNVNVATGFGVEDGGPELIVVLGALVSTVIERLAGVWSRLPAGSVARTRNVCAPLDREDVVNGDEQEVKEAVSTEHWNVEPVSVEAKTNVGVESLVGPLGPEVNDVSGASVSTVKLRVAGLWSVFPAASVARTSKVWAPSASTAVVTGETQPAKAAPSTEHSKVEPDSLDENAKVGVESGVSPVGPDPIVVCGGVASPACTVHEWLAGVASVFPAASVARTSNECEPTPTVYDAGEVHAAKAAPSSEQAKLEPVWLDVNSNVAS
jgi:hypothetical protein